jgi:hypothetical protein
MSMSDARLDVRVLAAEWLKDPAFKAEYDALEKEFAVASDRIRARMASPETKLTLQDTLADNSHASTTL